MNGLIQAIRSRPDKSTHLTNATLAVLVTGGVMLLGSRMTLKSCIAFRRAAWYPLMLLHTARSVPALEIVVGMYVSPTIGPQFGPNAHQRVPERVSIPEKLSAAPSPGGKHKAKRHAKSKADRAADEKSGPGRIEYDQRIVHRNAVSVLPAGGVDR